MNIIKMGEKFRVFDDGIEVSKKLQPATYEVCFSKVDGFYLMRRKNPDLPSGAVYGQVRDRLDKVMHSYSKTDRNLGVILSGAKGIGKSLFAKMLTHRAIKEGLPVLLVNDYFNGLTQFLASIEQRCAVVFDEFDKNFFDPSKETEDHTAVQDSLLTLFDGVYASNKLFVITANDLKKLSSFYINRPGRFRYHIRFGYPGSDEIRQFMADRLKASVDESEVENVIKFATMVPLSYDCLTAIAAELNLGMTFESSMEILNILNVRDAQYYTGALHFKGGETLRLEYIGRRNFFNVEDDCSIMRMDAMISQGQDDYVVGELLMRQGEVRKRGKFSQDGTIVVQLEKGISKWVRNRKTKRIPKEMDFSQPVELILKVSSPSNREISYCDMI